MEAVIREVTEEDYDEVVRIRKSEDIYRGMDYLPDYFRMMIKLPGYKSYGAMVKGKLVAVLFIGVIDGGMTVLARAGRVSKEYVGKGVYGKLDHFAVTKYKAKPGVLWCVATVNNENYKNHARKMIENKVYNLIVEKVIHTYTLKVEVAKKYTRGVVTPPYVARLNHADFSNLFDSSRICHYLFPEGRIVVDKVPLRLMEANIPHILTERCMAVGSYINDTSATYDHIFFTCGNFAACAGGLLYSLDLYGQNISELRHHMVFHLRRVQHFKGMDIHLEVNCYEYINKKEIDDILGTFGFQSIRSFRTHMYCVEVKYKQDPALYTTKPTAKL